MHIGLLDPVLMNSVCKQECLELGYRCTNIPAVVGSLAFWKCLGEGSNMNFAFLQGNVSQPQNLRCVMTQAWAGKQHSRNEGLIPLHCSNFPPKVPPFTASPGANL